MKAGILIVDDDRNLCQALAGLLEKNEYRALTAFDGTSALEVLKTRSSSVDLVLLDMLLPDISGMELLDIFGQEYPDVPVIVVTGAGTVQQAVEAMKKNAFDYVLKPFDTGELLLRMRKALENRMLRDNVDYLAGRLYGGGGDYIPSDDPYMRGVEAAVEKLAKSHSTTALISGHTGSGKEFLARRIHNLSARKNFAFVAVNAVALSEDLLESELFGHEEGAFTGAVRSKKGLFEVADGGTLFLDEIGDMGLAMQAKILRVIEDRSIRRVGGTQQIDVDVRLIAATNKNLRDAVKKGSFREDLFYRLNVVPLALPAFGTRKADIARFARHFIEMFNMEFGKDVREIDDRAKNMLEEYAWPGNIRELRNVIERAMLLSCSGRVLRCEDLGLEGRAGPAEVGFVPCAQINMELSLADVERRHIEGVLCAYRGNKHKTARILGIDRTTLYNKLKKYSISDLHIKNRPVD